VTQAAAREPRRGHGYHGLCRGAAPSPSSAAWGAPVSPGFCGTDPTGRFSFGFWSCQLHLELFLSPSSACLGRGMRGCVPLPAAGRGGCALPPGATALPGPVISGDTCDPLCPTPCCHPVLACKDWIWSAPVYSSITSE